MNGSRMWNGLKRSILGVAVGSLPIAAVAQSPILTSPFSEATGPSDVGTPSIGGTPTIDIIHLSANVPAVPLRYGGVVAGSEEVYLNGLKLVRATDYEFDAGMGVVYLMHPARVGDLVRVSYRYLKDYKGPSQGFAGLGTLTYSIAPGALSFKAGFGITERQADGNVLTSNIYGWNNSFGIGQAKLTGLFLYSERKKVDARSGYEYQSTPGHVDEGKSQFMVEKLTSSLKGGTVEINYQDIGKNFAGFGAVADSGVDKATVDQLAKEKGLTRMGMSMNDVDFGGTKISQAFKEVADSAGSIQWQSYGLTRGGFQLNWSQQKVGRTFARFADLGEANRGQLAKEAGLTREVLGGSYSGKFGKLSFDQNSIEDAGSQGIFRRTFALDTSKLKMSFGEQDVTSEFTRFGSLAEPEQAQWSREKGMNRRWFTLDYSMFGGKAAPIHFQQSSLSGNGSSFAASELTASSGKWSLDHIDIGSQGGSAGLGSLAQGEVDGHIRSIAGMYGQANYQIKPQDRNWFAAGAGIDRGFTHIVGEPFKNWNLDFEDARLKGAADTGSVDSVKLTGKQVTASYRAEHLGSKFTDIVNLMDFEKAQLGLISGFDRSDFSLSAMLGGKKTFAFSQTDATTAGAGGMKRSTFAYSDKGIDLTAARRNVGSAFPIGPQLADPERDLIGSLVGFKEQDVHLKWDIKSNLKLDTYMMDASNDTTKEQRYAHNTILSWTPDKNTSVGYVGMNQKSDDPLQVLLANSIERLTLTRNFGRYGVVNYLKEDIEYNGTLANLPGSHKEYISYETKLSQNTSLKTEQTTTSFDGGGKENISANTISAALTKKVGVSVTEVSTDKTGDPHNEKQNYGMWWDVGNGLRFSYGYARQIAGTADTQSQSVGLVASPGAAPPKIGDLGIMAAAYSQVETNSVTMQSANNIQLSTLKPFDVGRLFKEVKMSMAYDTQSNQATWVKKNQLFGMSGKMGSNAWALEYKGQALPTGALGIDRSIGFTTDQSEKRPLRASVVYKDRSLPTGQDLLIRNYTITARPVKGIEISNQLMTNPEVAKGDALLGSIVQASRANRWKLDYKGNVDTVFGASWEELINDQTHISSRTAGVTMVLRNRSGSPISLFYGLEDSNQNGTRHTAYRYQLQFDQKPGPNQTLSFFVGNVSYEGTPAAGFFKDNWSLKLDYQLRF